MNIRRTLNEIIKIIKDTIFPAHCFGCDTEGKFVCDDCYRTLDLSGVFCCPVCHVHNETGRPCIACTQKIYIDRHVAITPYTEDALIGDMMHSFKYHYAEDVREVFARMIDDFFSSHAIEVDAIIAVPLHRRRYVERGFNQSEIIAQFVARSLHIPIVHNLIRSRHTRQQAKLHRDERLKNLYNAFTIENPHELVGKRILVVDDVFTTGSTVSECAKVLKEAQVGEVVSFSVARG
ncbi:MAG: ComF family protein [Candidatus Magasanikbacteria bacterium]|nr:ComF family protein [Candidatus Magasanikbacteria bacterium]